MFVRSFMPSGNILESCSAGASGACCSVLRKYHDGWCERGAGVGGVREWVEDTVAKSKDGLACV